LTEAESRNYEIITENFNGKDIDFIKKDEKVLITARAIARGLEISKDNVNQIYRNHKNLLERHIGEMKIISPQGTRQITRVFDKTAFIWIAVRSNSPKAIPFQEWTIKVIDDVVNKGLYIERQPEFGSTDWALQTVEVMKSLLLNQKHQEERLKKLEEKDRYIFVIPRTKRKLQDEVHRIAIEYFNGDHSKVWNPLKAHFHVSRYEEFKEEDAQTILKGFVREHPPKFIQKIKENNQNHNVLPSKKEKRGLDALWDMETERKEIYEHENKEV